MTTLDVTKFSNGQLDTYIGNCQKHGRIELAREAAIERIQRGRYKQQHLALIDWTPSRVEQLLSPFAELATQVKSSKRKAYVEAGGRGRKSRQDPEALWIDQYCGIKAGGVNATISCHVKNPGDVPVLTLIDKSEKEPREMTYEPHDACVAMDDWLDVIARATGGRFEG
jgi:hypothetical protein